LKTIFFRAKKYFSKDKNITEFLYNFHTASSLSFKKFKLLEEYSIDKIKVRIVSTAEARYYLIDEPFLNKEEEKELYKMILDTKITLVEPDIKNEKIKYYYKREVKGFGAIDVPVKDPEIEDIYAAPGRVCVRHRKYGVLITNIVLKDVECKALVQRLIRKAGWSITIGDSLKRMPLEGMRLDVTIGELNEVSVKYYATIRKFPQNPYSAAHLIANGTMNEWVFAYLATLVLNKRTGLIIGPVGSGKTTLLWSLIGVIPLEKIVLIQEVPEIRLPSLWPLEELGPYRPGISSDVVIPIHRIIEDTLRGKSPGYIILGEIHQEEGYAWAQLGRTKKGTLATFHADDPKAAILALTSRPISIPKPLLFAALDFMVVMKNIRTCNTVKRLVSEIYVLEKDGKTLLKIVEAVDAGRAWRIVPISKIAHLLDPYQLPDTPEKVYLAFARLARYAIDKGFIVYEKFTRLLWRYYANPKIVGRKLRVIKLLPPTVAEVQQLAA